MKLTLLVPGLLAGLALGSAGSAQAPRQEAKPDLRFPSEVALVTVPVFVTDSANKAVGGLTVEDFQIEDEGRSVPITRFQEVDAEQAPAPGPAGRASLSPAARRYFLLFFDLSFSTPSGVLQARRASAEFVQKALLPSDLGAVATFSTSGGVKLLVSFTSDRKQLLEAVNSLDVLRIERRADPLLLTYDLPAPGEPMGGASTPGGEAVGRFFTAEDIREAQVMYRQAEAQTYKRKVAGLLDGMVQLARALDSVTGRKQVIFLSGGFNDAMLAGAEGSEQRANAEAVVEGRIWEVGSDTQFGDASVRQQLQKTLKTFAGTDCVVHTVDVTGLASSGSSVESAVGVDNRGRGGRQSLSQMAADTGGRFIKDTNDITGALAQILESSRRYYLLAFEPPQQKGVGRFHKLKVKVRRKGLSVSHRSGYLEAMPYAQRAPLVRKLEAAQMISSGVKGGAIEVQALAVPYRDARGRPVVAAVMEVDGTSLLDRPPAPSLPLEVFGYALDGEGRVEDVFHQSAELDLAKVGDRVRASGLQFHSTFVLPAGAHSLRFLVRDGANGRAGAYRAEIVVPDFGPGAVVVAPPLAMEEPGPWLVLSVPARSGAAGPTPFHVGKNPFLARARVVLVAGQTSPLCVLVYDPEADPEMVSFELKTVLVDATGKELALGDVEMLRSMPDPDGYRRILLNATPGPQAKGDYSLKVQYKDGAGGRAGEAELPVRFED